MSPVSYCGVISFLTYFYFAKPHPRKIIKCYKFYTPKDNSKSICFPASPLWSSPLPHSLWSRLFVSLGGCYNYFLQYSHSAVDSEKLLIP